jgi:acetyltransferase-like isoleucine patch superfamily enzyme
MAVLPQLLSFWTRSLFLGRDRTLEGSSQALALIPGITGQYLRRAFLTHVLAQCDTSATIEFGTIFSQTAARIEKNVYIGPRCHIGWAHLEAEVLLAAGVHVPSGARTHGTETTAFPIRDQVQRRVPVRIGSGTWVGSGAIVMADVGNNSVIGAGAVVTHPIPAGVVAAGVPARVVRQRTEAG